MTFFHWSTDSLTCKRLKAPDFQLFCKIRPIIVPFELLEKEPVILRVHCVQYGQICKECNAFCQLADQCI